MSKHDTKIKQLLEKVEDQQASLGDRPRASWLTNGIFRYPDGQHFNLNTVQDSEPLLDALAFLLEKQTLRSEAAKRLEIECVELSWGGFSLADWESDFKRRIEILAWQGRKKQLDATKKKLHSLVSEEGKTEMELSAIEKLLG